jgi:hypothetical protein
MKLRSLRNNLEKEIKLNSYTLCTRKKFQIYLKCKYKQEDYKGRSRKYRWIFHKLRVLKTFLSDSKSICNKRFANFNRQKQVALQINHKKNMKKMTLWKSFNITHKRWAPECMKNSLHERREISKLTENGS